MDTPGERRDQPGFKAGVDARFEANSEILAPGLTAPLPLKANPRHLLQGVFRLVLKSAGTPPELVEPASITGGGLVHACQEFVLASNRLISAGETGGPRDGSPGSADGPSGAVRGLLWAMRDFLGAKEAAYALEQTAQVLSRPAAGLSSGGEKEFGGLKGLGGPLEARFAELGLPRAMDPHRFALLQFHLEEVYDLAGREVQRFYRAAGGGEPQRFGAFARGLARVVTKEIVPDHLLALDPGPGRERTGLADLLPELARELG